MLKLDSVGWLIWCTSNQGGKKCIKRHLGNERVGGSQLTAKAEEKKKAQRPAPHWNAQLKCDIQSKSLGSRHKIMTYTQPSCSQDRLWMHLWVHRRCSKKKKWLNRAQAHKTKLKKQTQGKCSFFRSALLRVSGREKPQGNTMRIQKWLWKHMRTVRTSSPEVFINTSCRRTPLKLHPSGCPHNIFNRQSNSGCEFVAFENHPSLLWTKENKFTRGQTAIFTPLFFPKWYWKHFLALKRFPFN